MCLISVFSTDTYFEVCNGFADVELLHSPRQRIPVAAASAVLHHTQTLHTIHRLSFHSFTNSVQTGAIVAEV